MVKEDRKEEKVKERGVNGSEAVKEMEEEEEQKEGAKDVGERQRGRQ